MKDDLKQNIIESYLNWIRDNTLIKDLKSGIIKIVSPFLDARNDHIQIYARKLPNGVYRLTDGGYLFRDLESYGIDFTPKRQELFDFTLQSYGIKYNTKENVNEIYIDTDLKNIGRSKHKLIQCLITLNDFFNYTQQNVKELFFYDVFDHFKKSGVTFNYNFNIIGKTGYSHKFDFGIGIKAERPEILIKLVATPSNKQIAEATLFAFVDLRNLNRKFKGMIIYQGTEETANKKFLEACKNYEVPAYSWENKEQVVKELI